MFTIISPVKSISSPIVNISSFKVQSGDISSFMVQSGDIPSFMVQSGSILAFTVLETVTVQVDIELDIFHSAIGC